MRLTRPLLALAGASLAAAGVAQDAPPQETPPAQETPQRGLSGLEDTVGQLRDEQPAAETPAAPTSREAEPPAVPVPTVATPTAPAAPSRPAYVEPLSRAQRNTLDAAVQRGRILGAIARAGIVATQDMLSRVSDPAGAGISGWLAEPEGNAVTVTFYAEGDGGAPPSAIYKVTILGGRATARDVFLAGERPALTGHLARMAAARKATEGLDHQACGGEDFNVLVVPPAAPDAPIDVYQISPQTARGSYPLGGHFKTTIAPDGSVASSRGFTNACLNVAAADVVAGQRPEPIAVTHLLDPLPTEIHVFLAIWTGHPLIVVAGDPQRLFAVTAEGIAEVPR
ncbi:MAG TPA: hypothetical protein VEW04_06290 [Allosphingosinicella sp.]|nr:hypothetical protein [Allosphingosinicella sp.]